jgi:hypothetical protein
MDALLEKHRDDVKVVVQWARTLDGTFTYLEMFDSIGSRISFLSEELLQLMVQSHILRIVGHNKRGKAEYKLPPSPTADPPDLVEQFRVFIAPIFSRSWFTVSECHKQLQTDLLKWSELSEEAVEQLLDKLVEERGVMEWELRLREGVRYRFIA